LKKRLFKTMMDMGIEPGRYIVGNELNSRNPVTGQPEFFLKYLGRRLRKAAADISGYAAPIVGAMYGPLAGAAVGGALGQYKRENPGDPNQGMQMALRGGMSGLAANLASGQGLTPFGGARGAYGLDTINPVKIGKAMMGQTGIEAGQTGAGVKGFFKNPFAQKEKVSLDKFIENSGLDPNNLPKGIDKGDFLNSYLKSGGGTGTGVSLGKALGYGLPATFALAQLIKGEQPEGDDTEIAKNRTIYDQIFDPTEPVTFASKGGVMDLQDGGESKGPGTGTSDSIPAMLSDGEFVMTAKAVRGAGGGDRREGARKMYEAMDRLEARA
jgi:hypothetical protein